MPLIKNKFEVWIYKSNGVFFVKLTFECVKAQTAVKRAKIWMLQQRRLAHFYTYVPKEIK